MDVDNVLKNTKLVKRYLDCLLDRGRCEKNGKDWKVQPVYSSGSSAISFNFLKISEFAMENRRLAVAREEEQDDRMKTFIFKGEGHTLGNAIRTIILKNPDVIFCGYTIPHPSENKLHLRIETKSISAVDALREGLEQLQNLSDHILKTFETAVVDYKSNQMEV
uniref:DNA-directed RNA polymerases I and III subunit RPAC2 n=1 Tax=Daphnia pulex TaxID=6669 RepID=A0A4Y7MVH2_DAPPU|nr:EOG090X0LBP [Daphnia pulex]